jgi:hypothetical protein
MRQSCPVVVASHTPDVALLNCPTAALPVLDLSSRPYLDEKVAALGHPAGGPLRVTEGSVTNANPDRAGYVTIDARLIPGNSGGPVIDTSTGEVIGVGSAYEPNASGVDFAIPDATLAAFLDNPPAPVPTGPTTDGSEWAWTLGVGIVLGLAVGYALHSRVRRQSTSRRHVGRQTVATRTGLSAAIGEPTVILHGRLSSVGAPVAQRSSPTGTEAESGSELGIVLHPTRSPPLPTSERIHSSTDERFGRGVDSTGESGGREPNG